MGFGWGLLIGLLVGLVIVPIGFFIFIKVKEAKMRREVKRLLHQGKFLGMLDKKDFDVEMWKDKINLDGLDEQVAELSDKIFRRGKFKPTKDENDVEWTSIKPAEDNNGTN